MPQISDNEFVNRLRNATEQGRIDWKPTAQADEFTSSFGGKWTLILGLEQFGSPSDTLTTVILKNAAGDWLLQVNSLQNGEVADLYEAARRHALKIDEAITDLLNEIDNPGHS